MIPNDKFLKFKEDVKHGRFPPLCGWCITKEQAEEIKNLLLPFDDKKKSYFENIILHKII